MINKKFKLAILFILIFNFFLISCEYQNNIIIENIVGKIESNNLDFYTYKDSTGSQIFKISPDGYEVEGYMNANGFISLDDIQKLSDIYTNGNIENLYLKYGQPIAFFPQNKVAIFDGWANKESKFTIMSSEKEYIYEFWKCDFEEILIHTYEIKETIFFYSYNKMYEFNINSNKLTSDDYLYIPEEIVNGEVKIYKNKFINTDNMIISVISYLNPVSKIDKLSNISKDIRMILYTVNKDSQGFNYIELEEENSCIYYYDNNIYLLNFLNNQLYMSKYDKHLILLLKEQLELPEKFIQNISLSIYPTTYQNGQKVLISFPSNNNPYDIFVMQYNLKEFCIDYATILHSPKNYCLMRGNFTY